MKKRNRKIQLYAKRTLGDKINSTFDFVKENFSIWIKLMICFLMPVSILQGIAVVKGFTSVISSSFQSSGWLFIPYFLLGFTFTNAIVYFLMKEYHNRKNRLIDVTLKSCIPQFLHVLKKMIGVTLMDCFIFIPVLILGFFILLSIPGLGFLVFLAIIFSSIVIFMVAPHYLVNEGVSLWDATKRAIKLGFSSYWSLLGVSLTMYLVIALFQFFFFFFPLSFGPSVLNSLLGGTVNLSQSSQIIVEVITCVFVVFIQFLHYMLMSFFLLTMGYHYGAVANEEEYASLASDIEEFENL